MPVLRVGTKADLIEAAPKDGERRYDLAVSTVSGLGLAGLLDELGRLANEAAGTTGELLPSRLRHVELLEASRSFIDHAAGQSDAFQELRAEDLRLAGDRLGRIVGTAGVEDLLDVIFSQFCIGK